MTSIALKKYTFCKGSTKARLRLPDFCDMLKTNLWPPTVSCSMVGLLQLWHIPHFRSFSNWNRIVPLSERYWCNRYENNTELIVLVRSVNVSFRYLSISLTKLCFESTGLRTLYYVFHLYCERFAVFLSW